MDPASSQKIKCICNSALNPGAEKREGYLEEACGRDPSLRADIESLLKNHSESEDLMRFPAMDAAAQMIASEQAKFGIKAPKLIRLTTHEGRVGGPSLSPDESQGLPVTTQMPARRRNPKGA